MIDRDFWSGRRVFLTGHTGFKGAWASLLLASMGAQVFGYALAPESDQDLFTAAKVADDIRHREADIRDADALRAAMAEDRPEIVIHMAAQALVRPSYESPLDTFMTNVMGTAHVLDAVRHVPSVRAVVVVTSDKCYDNVGWVWGYRETDPLGGHDPYSNSKACAELVTDSYRRSFFGNRNAPCVASARAGNVVGGGDWARDRLVPDAMRAFLRHAAVHIRSPRSIRPWQHVLDPVIGYLVLAQRLVQHGREYAEAWNFGPTSDSDLSVGNIADMLVELWGGSARWETDAGVHPHEAAYLRLDCSKARSKLNWRPLFDVRSALALTVEWYRAFGQKADMRAVTSAQIVSALSAASPAVEHVSQQRASA